MRVLYVCVLSLLLEWGERVILDFASQQWGEEQYQWEGWALDLDVPPPAFSISQTIACWHSVLLDDILSHPLIARQWRCQVKICSR